MNSVNFLSYHIPSSSWSSFCLISKGGGGGSGDVVVVVVVVVELLLQGFNNWFSSIGEDSKKGPVNGPIGKRENTIAIATTTTITISSTLVVDSDG